MSCNTSLPITDIAERVAALLGANYIDKDDPRIHQGVFTEPTIRGGLTLDEAAKEDFCELSQQCDREPPFGKVWVAQPLYPGMVLASVPDGEDVLAVWRSAVSRGPTESRPIDAVLGHQHFDSTLTPAGRPIWWTGLSWVDAAGEEV